jgi:hypothetical protein
MLIRRAAMPEFQSAEALRLPEPLKGLLWTQLAGFSATTRNASNENAARPIVDCVGCCTVPQRNNMRCGTSAVDQIEYEQHA